jgi:hypothetical protein
MDAATKSDEKIIKPLDPGIYFNLDEETYHSDPSLGSSDERKLAKNPSDYWFESWMNPNRPSNKSTPSQQRGTAVHVLVLYGEAEFDKRYMRGADNTDDMTSAEKAAATKEANKRAAARGVVALPAAVYDNIAIASAMIAKNPKLGRALTGGLNEVSIFWRDPKNKLPKKARIDCLKATTRDGETRMGLGDLKSLANKYDKPFDKACIDSITNYRYDVQAKHYMNGAAFIPKLVADGCVHGTGDPEILKRVCSATQMAWQFVFWQAEGAPITFSKIISPANPILEVSQAMIDRADANYIAYMERFGPREMWLLEEEPSELYLEEMPPWFARD